MAPTSLEVLTKAFSHTSPSEITNNEQACLPEFELHLRSHPDDTNFCVEFSQPGTGYGKILCLENGCLCEVTLGPSFTCGDGGISRGFGSFANYWEHIKSSAGHVQARNQRLEVDKLHTPAKPVASTSSSKQYHNSSGLSSEMDDLYSRYKGDQVDVKPRIGNDKPLSNGSSSSHVHVPKKRLSEGLPRSSAGKVFTDDESDPDKKPKLDVKPGIFSDRQNAPRSNGARTPADEIKTLEGKLERLQMLANEMRQASIEEREPNHFQELDSINRQIQQVQFAITDWERINGPRPSNRTPQIPPIPARPQDLGIGGSGGGGGLAGGTGYHADAETLHRLQIARARGVAGVESDDPMAAAMNALTATNPNAAPDPYDIARGRPMQKNEDFDEFVKKTLEGESFEGNANVDAAAQFIGLKTQTECLPNMTIPLMPHQLIGVAWAKEQEASKHYGGILADEMGLGKTIEMIALMCANESKDIDEKSTLVVAPLALLEQWKSEIEEKTVKGHYSILIYHGPDRKRIKVKNLKKYDVVLTTYTTLTLDFPDEEAAMKKAKVKAKKHGGDPEDYFEVDDKKGPLIEMQWYRVILDEAQNIRNRQTKMSRAVSQLDALYRWCLTGTPVTNSLGDLFPLLRFLQIAPWYEWTEFRDHVVRHEKTRGNVAGSKAQVILRGCMLRRKKDSKLDGKDLICLPTKHIEMLQLDFSEEEREIYTTIEKKAQKKFKKFLAAGTVLKNYSTVLVLLLRLRQLCFHPALIADAEATLQKKDDDKEKFKNELKRAKTAVSADFVVKIQAMRLEAAIDRSKAERSGSEASNSDECSICLEEIQASESGGVVTRCGHVFCKACIVDTISAPRIDETGEDASGKCKEDQRPCPICRAPVGEVDLFDIEAFEPSDELLADKLGVEIDVDGEDDDDADETLNGFIVPDGEDGEDSDFVKKAKVPFQRNRAVIQDSDDEGQSEAEEEPTPSRKKDKGKSKAEEKKEKKAAQVLFLKAQEPSTKMLWVLAELEKVFAENPDDKVLIISSFTSALDMLQDFLDTKDIKTTRYQGDMKNSDREHSLKVLKKSKKCKVMLLSIKCGGVGLTLTRANRVISLDLAWSYAIEAQSYDRAHRIGQTKEVFVKRLTIKDTVEQRIHELQARKQGLADAAFGEGKAQRFGKLTVDDIAMLFGVSTR